MIQRILTLLRYLFNHLVRSLSGVLYLIISLIFVYVFFLNHNTPDFDYYMLLLGVLGVALSFLITLSVASVANQATSYPLLVRLPSRIEFLVAVMGSSLLYTTLLQWLMALLALRSGVELTLAHVIELPPLWLAANILTSVLALHASDLAAAGWSRTIIYGILTILLFGQSGAATLSQWVGSRFLVVSNWFFQRGLTTLGNPTSNLANWFNVNGGDIIKNILSFVFWPLRATTEAAQAGVFTPTQALAPAILLLYATILFMLAADLFATKDLHLTE
ncbi:MAG: hypothetical protein KA314_26820 [Chloroflexi bacterium]|nr:hypothetical protein [Chloroflexota bacterium]MBP8059465.1 hypothetical protein [Chloroflexota bacterium]